MNHLNDEQLNEYLDHESQERAQIKSHLASCDECSARMDALQALFTELDSLPEATFSNNLAGAVLRQVSGSAVLPKWLTLTVALQAVLALITALVAAPFVIEFMGEVIPTFHSPSIPTLLMQLQTQWMRALDVLSTFHMPILPALPTPQFSSLMIPFALAGASMLWLLGNGLLLRNQIK